MIPHFSLSLRDIQPFVRYVQLLQIHPNEYPVFTRSYDCRLFYVYRGEGSLLIGDKVYPISHGCIAFWQPDIEYRMESDEGGMQFLCVNFDLTQNHRDKDYPIPPDRSDLFDAARATEHISFTDIDALRHPVFLRDMQSIEDGLQEMKREYQAQKLFWRERLGGLMHAIVVSIARSLSHAALEGVRGDSFIDPVISYIQAHANARLTNEALGRHFNYHPNYLNKQMLLHTGKSLHQYLLTCRIANAIELLERTAMPIAKIAETTGIGDISHFSKLFKSKTGHSPSYYRRPR